MQNLIKYTDEQLTFQYLILWHKLGPYLWTKHMVGKINSFPFFHVQRTRTPSPSSASDTTTNNDEQVSWTKVVHLYLGFVLVDRCQDKLCF